MVEFGSQIQGVQGDEPGEAVMLDSSGQIPSSGSGGLKWTRIPYNSTLEIGKIYKVITTLGSAEFMPSSDINYVHFVSNNQTGSGNHGMMCCYLWIYNMKLDSLRDSQFSPEYSADVSANNCALFVLEE